MTPSISSPTILEQTDAWKEEFGFDLLAWAPLPQPTQFQFYSNWLKEQRHGDMKYLETHAPLKEDPARVFGEARSLISVAVLYKPHPEPLPETPTGVRLAAYAQGGDYHDWLSARLTSFAEALKSQHPGLEYLVATDSKPLLERDLANQLGLGWTGKNTCLIHPKVGSFFLIGELLTNIDIADFTAPEPVPDFCGKCTRCMDACPTGAIVEPRKLDATKCISYWTIESKSIAPEPVRSQIGDWFFGCDICQDVCPWNEKALRLKPSALVPRSREQEIEDLRFFLTASNREIERRLGASPVLRGRPRGLRRNAMVVAGNLGLQDLKEEIARWTTDADLGELARWAFEKISRAPAS
ncbi:MAG: tRNA epoxyqueuosine(34) reductase QueG [Bdellovibrionaceae bacterium]|nr:tRNA epoxyqueuosine(34) reductase QueG [Pseudobdellovibrionaceae bacterium]